MAALFETELARAMAAAELARRRPRPSVGGRAHVTGAKVAERQLPRVAGTDAEQPWKTVLQTWSERHRSASRASLCQRCSRSTSATSAAIQSDC